MNHPITLLLGLLLMLPGALLGQEEDCRLELDDLQPVIQRFNPYFANHQWSLENRMELARIGNERLLMITQDGCKRHHTVFTLVLNDAVIDNHPDFWEQEALGLLRKVYFEEPVYLEFQRQFEEQFQEKFDLYGLGRRFNFPVGTRNFICEIRYEPEQGARIMIEMVEYIFKQPESSTQRSAPSEHDDGWLGNGEG